MRFPLRLALALAALGTLAACDATGNDGSGPPIPDEVVDGVNLSDLFARPTNGERAAVRAEWAARDAARSTRYTYTLAPAVRTADGADLIVYTVRAGATGDVLHHGVVRLPPRAGGDVAPRPVVLVVPPHTATLTLEAALSDVPLAGPPTQDVVHVVVAFRGQTLDVAGTAYASPADPAATYDLDVDDALALLDAVLAREPLADDARVAVAGYDRGGTAALLAAERDAPAGLALVTSLAAPTDFFQPSVRQAARHYLTGTSTGALPAFDDVAATVLAPLRGGQGDLAAARRALLRRSPAYFVGPPPFVFAAHGALDPVVPVGHGRALSGVIGTEGASYLESEEDDHGSLPDSPTVVSTASSLFLERVRGTDP